jgi:hypothetical protein
MRLVGRSYLAAYFGVGHYFVDNIMGIETVIAEPVTAHNAGIAPQLAIARHRPGVCEFFRSASRHTCL